MWNITKHPFEKESLDDWAKLSIDIAKVAFLAMPVILYGKEPIEIKILHTILLMIGAYIALSTGRKFRKIKQEMK